MVERTIRTGLGARGVAVAAAIVLALPTLAVAGAPPAAAEPEPPPSIRTMCDIEGVKLPVTVPFAATGSTVAEIAIGFPTLPIEVTVDEASVTFPIPAWVATVDSITFEGGNVAATYAVTPDAVVVTVSGPAASSAIELPTAKVSVTARTDVDPASMLWESFSTLTASTNAGTATCAPSDEPAPPPLTPPAADPDPFYTPPAGFEAAAPGAILRTRPATFRAFGRNVPVRTTQALFRTTDTAGAPVATVTTLLESPFPYKRGDRPLVAYQVAIDSLGAKCQPSHTFTEDAGTDMFLMAGLLLRGYDVVVTDYEGPRFAYGAGVMLGQATLDGIRAVEALPGTGLAGAATPVGMWGYSGGAIATGWAAELQPTYAPELNLKAVAPGGTPADLLATARHMDGSFMSGFMVLVAVAIAREYPYFAPAFNDRGRDLAAKLSDVCSGEVFKYPFLRIADFLVVPEPLTSPLVVAALEQTKLGRVAPTAPVFLYHAVHDEGIPFAEAATLRDDWCRLGANVTFYADHASEHVLLPIIGSWRVISFLSDRFNGVPTSGTC